MTKNFKLSEFTICAGEIIKPTDEQIFCIEVLCKNLLQPIRDTFGSMNITSGLRDERTNNILKQKGYPASSTSDHMAWSTGNPKGTGAADFVCINNKMDDIFKWIIKNLSSNFRQVIYYPDKNFIHVSNAFDKIFAKPDTILSSNRILINNKGNITHFNEK